MRCALKDLGGIGSSDDSAAVLRHESPTDKGGKWQVADGRGAMDEVGRGIDVSAVVGAHAEGSKITGIAIGDGSEQRALRSGIAWVHAAAKDGLGKVEDFHVCLPSCGAKITW